MNALPTPAAPASGPRSLTDVITEIRAIDPGRVGRALAQRPRADLAGAGRLMVIACDHPAREALGTGERPLATADREDLLRRCMTALSRLGVNGFPGVAETTEDLILLGALDGKFVWGPMNQIGLQGVPFEMDDRFGTHDADGIKAPHLDGGKMLTRINDADPASAVTLEASAKTIDPPSERSLNVMAEPFISRQEDGRIVNDLSEEAIIRSIYTVQALGCSSAHTRLKLLRVNDSALMRRVMAPTSPSSLILGGEVSTDPEATRASWAVALEPPNVRGLVVGRSLSYPGNDDVEVVIDVAVALL